MDNDKVRTSVVGAGEFPDMIRRYRINGVPKTVVNETVEIMGAQPEDLFVAEALRPFTEEKPTQSDL